MHFNASYRTNSICAATLCVLLTVSDGETIRCGGERIRLMGIDTPNIELARCEREWRLGMKAKGRLEQLLSSGGVQIRRQTIRRGNWALARVFVNGEDVAATLIREGLGRPYRTGRRGSWCR
ncbi:MAG: thermonuclease family protein [Hyphomicrobiales bacterium]|nr:thermonuclease family protein [Hyphomicrobiales bacterium]